jgi:uncharacterized protein
MTPVSSFYGNSALGARREQAYFRHLTVDEGLDVVNIPTDISLAEGAVQTVDALRRGASVIYQATFQSGPWHGRSDFLIRVPKPSVLGAWSYEPLETKRALSTKAGALVQLCFYADLLSQMQGVQPDWVHTVLGNDSGGEISFRAVHRVLPKSETRFRGSIQAVAE